MNSWVDFVWILIGALFLGAPAGAVVATAYIRRRSEVDGRDIDRNALSQVGRPTPGPWEYRLVTRRVTAPSIMTLDTGSPGPLYADAYGLTPRYKDAEGMMVCESVNPDDGPLIAAAPQLLELAESILGYSAANLADDIEKIRLGATELVTSIRNAGSTAAAGQ